MAARNIPNKVDDEQDSNSDNNEQPSPVSILEAPFEEESPCLEFKEIANGLQGCYPWLSIFYTLSSSVLCLYSNLFSETHLL